MPSESRRRARTYDPDRTWGALTAQVGHVRTAVRGLTGEQWKWPAGLPGWDVRLLVVHVLRQVQAIRLVLDKPAPAPGAPVLGPDRWALSTGGIADRLDAGTREQEARTEDPLAALEQEADALPALREEAVRTDRLVPSPFGAMRALDFTVTRLVELVVHSDDLARAAGVEVGLDRQAVAAAVRVLADALAVKAPGNSVEVRVPPYAAVQCVAGPRHTRGTPPNVVETTPATWLRLATGRTTWSEELAAAHLSASGERADLAPHLPVLG
ncbi:maleylpyruvate isomerase family mycothiol-dependent enzyme [Actinacidiphila guanduensis]|uniref:TIGR03083 family protein n=1 Tax=Actinacidiphila guanduensis TaxID=310781 RepID=A0A1G9YER4_9ACTN|nr:maleylpyruvate isomerase family mycothiol-dependent enzyme [Actinacidiphila guanduensis]SDN07096.1 TIGR03083 family protein [Actinacidiphila guanduensis]